MKTKRTTKMISMNVNIDILDELDRVAKYYKINRTALVHVLIKEAISKFSDTGNITESKVKKMKKPTNTNKEINEPVTKDTE